MEYRDPTSRGPVVWDSARSWHSLSREALSNTFCSWLMGFTARFPNQTTAVSSFYILFALRKMLSLQKICKKSTKNSDMYFTQGIQRLPQVSPIVPEISLWLIQDDCWTRLAFLPNVRQSGAALWSFLELHDTDAVETSICRMFLNLSLSDISSSLDAYYIFLPWMPQKWWCVLSITSYQIATILILSIWAMWNLIPRLRSCCRVFSLWSYFAPFVFNEYFWGKVFWDSL